MHEPVDDLCKKAASLWARGEMLGIATAADALLKAATWQNGINALCIIGRRKLSTRLAVMADKETERLPHIYLAVIFAQDGEAWELRRPVDSLLPGGGTSATAGHTHAREPGARQLDGRACI